MRPDGRDGKLAEITLGARAAPPRIDAPEANLSMKRGMRPVDHPVDKTVADRVGPAILEMADEIVFVTDVVFPEAVLPDAKLPLA